VLITFKRTQPRDIYTTLWHQVEALLRQGGAVVPQKAVAELSRGTDTLASWVKQTGAVYHTDAAVIGIVAQISARHPGWVQQTKNVADPFIIATAKVLGAVVVTNERSRTIATADANLRIPQVAAEFGVATLSTNDLFRRLGWRF
jgi:hypothetical protein